MLVDSKDAPHNASKATVEDLWSARSAASPAVAPSTAGEIKNTTVRPHATVVLRVFPSKWALILCTPGERNSPCVEVKNCA